MFFGLDRSLLTAQNEAYILGDADNNFFTTVRAFDDGIYAVGQVNDGTQNFATFSRIDPANGQVVWTSRMDIQSTFLDFIRDDEGTFILVGRTDIRAGLNGAFLNNESLIARVDDNGNFLGVRSYNLDTQGGRETFSKIVRNPNPLNEEFPYYVFGVRDRDDLNFANTWDDVTLSMVDINLNIGFYQRMSTNINGAGQDDEFIRAAAPLMDGSGNIILAGNGSGLVVNIIIIDNQGQYVNGATFPANQLQVVRDLLVLPEGDFIFVGQTARANSNNFIIRVDPTLTTVIWQFELFNQGFSDQIIEWNGAYYTVARNFAGANGFFVNRIIDVGNTAFLDWTASLDDNDMINNWPFLATDGMNLIYGDSRTPVLGGNGTSAGFGGNDVLLTVTDETLVTCITEFQGIEMVGLDVDIMPLVSDERRMEVPGFTGRELFVLDYQSENNCEQPCGALIEGDISFDCTNGPTYTVDVQFQNNDPALDVTGVFIANVTPANATVNPLFYSFIPPNAIPAMGGISNPPSQMTISFPSPITTPTDVCFDVIYFAGNFQCCTYEHCITLMPEDPCASVSASVVEDGDCCYDLELQNDFCADYFTGIQTNSLTQGVTFGLPVGGTGWAGAANPGATSIDWDLNTGNLPLGTLTGIDFCLEGVTSQAQIPQLVEVVWLAIDPITGQEVVVCRDTVELNCEPCLTIDGNISCGPGIGNYTFNFTVTSNASNPNATNLILQSWTTGVTINPNTFTAITLPPGGTFSGTTTISTTLPAGTVIDYRVIIFDTNINLWCCHLDAQLTIPACPSLRGTDDGPVFSLADLTPSTSERQNARQSSGPDVAEKLQLDAKYSSTQDLVLYPVPASDYIFMSTTLEGELNIDLIHSDGRILKAIRQHVYKGDLQQIDISTLPDGMYFARCTSEDGTVVQKRFIKASR